MVASCSVSTTAATAERVSPKSGDCDLLRPTGRTTDWLSAAAFPHTPSPVLWSSRRAECRRGGTRLHGARGSDLEELLLFVADHRVDLGHEFGGELVEFLLGPLEVVLGE